MLKSKSKTKSTKPVFTIDGAPIKNMTKPVLLVINEADCKAGNKKAPNSCAAALAAKRIPNCIEARVHISTIFLKVRQGKKEVWLRGKTPNSLRTEIVSFDRGGNFEPGTYKINPLPPSDRANGKHMGGVTVKGAKKKKTRTRLLPRILHNVRGNAHSEFKYK